MKNFSGLLIFWSGVTLSLFIIFVSKLKREREREKAEEVVN